MVKHRDLADWIDERQEQFITISDTIWANPEVALAETAACDLQANILESDGFNVTRNVGDLPTAFMAEWGSGSPVIGFLGEYDALAGLSQNAEPTQDPAVVGGPGHGCGHNLLGTASLAAAMTLKSWLESTGRSGVVRYYGCPAEEVGAGKVFMARAGVFDDLDAALTWHPGSYNTAWQGSSLAIDHIRFRFHGRTAHAAGAPELGRSALDAVELTNIGVNFLREHVIDSARIHYVITNGGGQPNVVPAEAEVWYYIRAPRRDQVEEITARVRKIAAGAAMMTETRLEEREIHGLHNYIANQPMTELMYNVLQELGEVEFTDEEREFARTITEAYPPEVISGSKRNLDLPADAKNEPLLGGVYPPRDKDRVMSGSTDVAEVSWITPTAQITTSCWALGVPGHSWGITATGGMSIGHKGMLHAAKAMAVGAAELYDDPDLIARARADHESGTDGTKYHAPIPEGTMPPKPQIAAL